MQQSEYEAKLKEFIVEASKHPDQRTLKIVKAMQVLDAAELVAFSSKFINDAIDNGSDHAAACVTLMTAVMGITTHPYMQLPPATRMLAAVAFKNMAVTAMEATITKMMMDTEKDTTNG